jgi:hypothetical protein
MTATNKLGLEMLQNAAANQTLANTTFARLNQLVQAGVVDKDLAAPPASPADESLYIVGASATGAWAGRDGQLAYWLITAGAWQFITPKEGFFLHVNDEDVFYKFTGAAWEVFSGGGGGGMTNPMMSIRDLIVGGVGGAPTRLPGPTSEGLVLTRIGNALAWAIATGFANPMTAGGDLIIGGTNGAATRLGAGTVGQVLTMVSGAPVWVTPSGSAGDFKADGSVQMTGGLNFAPLVSHSTDTASVIPLAKVAASNTLVVSGAAALTGLAAMPDGAQRLVQFIQGIKITHGSGVLELFGGADIQAEVGDWALFKANGPTNGWKMAGYSKYSGEALRGFQGGHLTRALDEATYNDGGYGVADGVLVLTDNASNTALVSGGSTVSRITGGSGKGTTRRLIFPGGGTLVNSDTYLDLPGGADLVLQSGDVVEVLAVSATKWRVVGGMRKNGQSFASAVTSVAGRTGAVTLTKSDVGLANADNTADSAKPVSVAQQAALDLKVNTSSVQTTQNDRTNNALMKVGAFGLGRFFDYRPLQFGGSTPPSTFFSTGTMFGFVAGGYSTQTQPGLEIPALIGDLNYGVLTVHGHWSDSTGGGGVQQAFTTGNREFTRLPASATTWLPWREKAYTDNTALVGNTTAANLSVSGPVRVGQYTLTTLPAASAFNGYEIDVTNATASPAGPKRCRSNGTNWLILNTNTPVS